MTKYLFKGYLVVMVFLLSYSVKGQSQNCDHDKANFRCVKYIRNYDADTVTFNIPNIHPIVGNKVNIRVNGVDTPEIRTKNQCEKKKAVIAKKYAQTFLKNAKVINLENIQRGKYFRIVADVIIDGKSLTEMLLVKGLAYPYDGGTKRKVDWCKTTRSIASENRLKR